MADATNGWNEGEEESGDRWNESLSESWQRELT